MRIAFASLLAATAFVSVAQAQTPSDQPPAAPAAPPATPAAPPSTTPPAATPPASPAPDAAQPPAPPAAPAAEAPPTLPTTGDGAALISLIEKVCVPLVRGGNLDDIAKANANTLGLKKNRRDNTWSMPLGPNKDYSVTLSPSGVNKDVCRGEVHYALNEDKPIVSAINIWSFLHQPELILQANYVSVNADGIKRVQKSWEHLDASSSQAVNFTTWTKPDDSSLNAKYSTGEIFYQERKLP